ncbi:MAG: ATPase, T2SS/T4P/T4SS family [Promethearchaeota archaeon]
MKSKIENLNQLQIKEGLNNEEERIFTFDCSECLTLMEKNCSYDNCVNCFLKGLYLRRNNDFENSIIKIHEGLINPNKVIIFLDYFKKLNYVKKIWKKIEKVRRNNCIYHEFNCKVESINDIFRSLNETIILDPISVFNFIYEKKEALTTHKNSTVECQVCFKKISYLFEVLLVILNKFKIIKLYKDFLKNPNHSKDKISFYKKNIFALPLDSKKNQEIDKNSWIPPDDLFESYYTGENQIFHVSIFRVSGEYEKKYLVHYAFESMVDEEYFKTVVNDAKNNLEQIEFNELVPLEKLLEIYKEKASQYLDLKYKLSHKEKEKAAYITALLKLNLKKIFPLLVDDLIEEIFLDSPNEKIYINHQKFGRCRTEIEFDLNDIERIKTFLRIYSGKRLDYSNPSLKVVIKNKYFYCRFAIDVEPIQVNYFALDIRKLNKNILTIQDLLKNGTLNPTIASFLYFLILRRINVTVTGETDTGKTTLINALDLLTPKEFRKIYVENIIESLNQTKYDRHQLKYKVDSLHDQTNQQLSKQTQIKNLLHRTPDIIYLGEILTKNEAEAMFHCLAAGLRGFQTIHSDDFDSLINRITFHFKIDKSCLRDLGLIILMKKNREKRFIESIAEINENLNDNYRVYNNIFKYDPHLKKWDVLRDLYNSNIVNKLRKYEDIHKEKFEILFNLYRDIFSTLQTIEKLEVTELIKLFDRISYQSFNSIETLRLFWDNWKKSCSLN